MISKAPNPLGNTPSLASTEALRRAKISVNEIRKSKTFWNDFHQICSEAKSPDMLFSNTLPLLGRSTHVIGRATKFNTETGVPTEIRRVGTQNLERVFFRLAENSWKFESTRTTITAELSSLLIDLWTLSVKNTIYSVDRGAYRLNMIDRVERHSGGHNDGTWSERIQGIEVLPVLWLNPTQRAILFRSTDNES